MLEYKEILIVQPTLQWTFLKFSFFLLQSLNPKMSGASKYLLASQVLLLLLLKLTCGCAAHRLQTKGTYHKSRNLMKFAMDARRRKNNNQTRVLLLPQPFFVLFEVSFLSF